MKIFKAWFFGLCGLMVLSAAMLAPVVVDATCPRIEVSCANGSFHSCVGQQDGQNCIYKASCLNC